MARVLAVTARRPRACELAARATKLAAWVTDAHNREAYCLAQDLGGRVIATSDRRAKCSGARSIEAVFRSDPGVAGPPVMAYDADTVYYSRRGGRLWMSGRYSGSAFC